MAALPLPTFACPGCSRTDGWVRVGDLCRCGWTSPAHRRKKHIRGYYATKYPPRPT